MSVQLPLGIRLRESATFASFHAGRNQPLIRALQQGGDTGFYFWGESGSGKTHLLQALCHARAGAGERVMYLPLAEPGLQPAMLEDPEHCDLICVDDLQQVAGQKAWEEALFHAYNRLQSEGGRLVIAADRPLASLPIRLPDLASRLGWGLVFRLQEPDDGERQAALQLRARTRGLELPDEVAAYLLRRVPRDMKSLFALLDRLDEASLAAQRKLTIPFVREFV